MLPIILMSDRIVTQNIKIFILKTFFNCNNKKNSIISPKCFLCIMLQLVVLTALWATNSKK